MDTSILLQVGVKIFLKNTEGKYLLLKRSPIRYPEVKNFWDIPGGRILPGTPLLENVMREVLEETKLPVLGQPRLLAAQDIIKLPEKHIVRLTFSAETNGEPKLGTEDPEYQWVSLDEMRAIPELDEFTREVLEQNFSKI